MPTQDIECTITTDDAVLKGLLNVPEKSQGIVAFAHGSGSSRFSKRNNAVGALEEVATLTRNSLRRLLSWATCAALGIAAT